MKKAVMIIAYEMFQDKEYEPAKKALEAAGIQTVTASTKLGNATGKFGEKVKVDITLDQVKVDEYDAVLFIGGPGSFELYDNPTCHKIAQDTIKAGKILAAICAAPGILVKAGVLKGKKMTMFTEHEVLSGSGAIYTGKGVEIDGLIITATGPETAQSWGETICKMLK